MHTVCKEFSDNSDAGTITPTLRLREAEEKQV